MLGKGRQTTLLGSWCLCSHCSYLAFLVGGRRVPGPGEDRAQNGSHSWNCEPWRKPSPVNGAVHGAWPVGSSVLGMWFLGVVYQGSSEGWVGGRARVQRCEGHSCPPHSNDCSSAPCSSLSSYPMFLWGRVLFSWPISSFTLKDYTSENTA